MKETAALVNSSGYQAAREGQAFFVREAAGYVQLGGDSRQDYLQRQTSNDLNMLSPNRALPNVLTSPSGRILEIFTVIELGENYALLTPQKRGPALANYFKERIFFSDLVSVEDQSDHWIQVEITGPKAAKVITKLFGVDQEAGLNRVDEGQFGEWQPLVIAQRAVGNSLNFLVLVPKESRSALENALVESDTLQLSYEEYDLLRIEAGLPGPAELTANYTPYEVGLNDRVSETKGCYTGQEVLARQVTYDKITRKLVQLSAEGPINNAREVLANGKVIGEITSSVLSPTFGPIALAVLKRPHNDIGSEIQIRDENRTLSARVITPALGQELV